MQTQTIEEHNAVIRECKSVFQAKTRDYGTSWRFLRLPSITDQILIKGLRIRSIQEKQVQLVDESIGSDFIAIVNYSVIAILQIRLEEDHRLEIPYEEAVMRYDEIMTEITSLLKNKNHDYGEAWRDMRISSMTDIILTKLLRIKQIEENEGKTLISEGVESNYMDIINYGIFSLIKLGYTE